MQLKNKKILIISPQLWGKMFISKHHYAVELAARGNKVYFLNPPIAKIDQEFLIDENEGANLYIIHHKLNFSYKLKFKAPWLFHILMKGHIKRLLAHIKDDFDIIWSFDLGNLYPFRFFNDKSIKVFHPVDEPTDEKGIMSATGADILFSTTNEILNKYNKIAAPKYFINHGLNDIFIKQPANDTKNEVIKIGYSGNLLRKDLDRETLLNIIKQNEKLQFNCWGSYDIKQSNIAGATDEETKEFINELKALPNIILHGVKITNELAAAYQNMDAFLICYKVVTDKSIGENYHKTLEFLSTGKVIISHCIGTYKNDSSLIQMDCSVPNNDNLPALFKTVTENLDLYNTNELALLRKNYAKDNLYSKQVDRIEKYLQQYF